MRFITRLVEERPRHLEWVQYPVHNFICKFRSLGVGLEIRMGGWAFLCRSLREYTREFLAGLVFSPSVSYMSPVPFLVCVVALESCQSNFSRTLPEQLPGWSGGWHVCLPNGW